MQPKQLFLQTAVSACNDTSLPCISTARAPTQTADKRHPNTEVLISKLVADSLAYGQVTVDACGSLTPMETLTCLQKAQELAPCGWDVRSQNSALAVQPAAPTALLCSALHLPVRL